MVDSDNVEIRYIATDDVIMTSHLSGVIMTSHLSG